MRERHSGKSRKESNERRPAGKKLQTLVSEGGNPKLFETEKHVNPKGSIH